MKPTAQEIVEAVAEMRHWQKEFFRTRQAPAVAKAKSLERKVDKLLDEWSRPSLFDRQNEDSNQ